MQRMFNLKRVTKFLFGVVVLASFPNLAQAIDKNLDSKGTVKQTLEDKSGEEKDTLKADQKETPKNTSKDDKEETPKDKWKDDKKDDRKDDRKNDRRDGKKDEQKGSRLGARGDKNTNGDLKGSPRSKDGEDDEPKNPPGYVVEQFDSMDEAIEQLSDPNHSGVLGSGERMQRMLETGKMYLENAETGEVFEHDLNTGETRPVSPDEYDELGVHPTIDHFERPASNIDGVFLPDQDPLVG